MTGSSCEAHITQPEDTVLVLIFDLYEGGVAAMSRKTDLNVWVAGAGIAAVPASAVK